LDLRYRGINAWMDKPPRPYHLDGLKPGETWDFRLRQVISTSSYFIACFSTTSVEKFGYVQSEFRQAINRVALLPHGQRYVIPVRLDECRLPSMRVDGISFDQYQWIDCFAGNFMDLVHFLTDRIEIVLPKEVAPGGAAVVSPATGTEFFDLYPQTQKFSYWENTTSTASQ
jgi:hypothetical protein